MIILGLTGSIGMGKSTTAAMFADAGIPVHDADATVHQLYKSGPAVLKIEAAFPGTTSQNGVDRAKLGQVVFGDAAALKKLEEIVHPFVQSAEKAFLQQYVDHRLVVLDIPLLFETGGDSRVDKILVVTAPAEVQQSRVLSRPGMTKEQFEKIIARQMPDREKRKKADFIIDTSLGLEHARTQVASIIEKLSS